MSRFADVHPDDIDPETGAPYANYSSPSLGDPWWAEEQRALAAVERPDRIRALVRQWKCDGCGGSGKYLNRSRERGAEEITCKRCGGGGLSPKAVELLALLDAADSTD